jgi:ribonuclease P protein component
MLSREHRLTSSRDFTATVRRGRRAGSRTLVAHLLVDGSAPDRPARVGFVVSKAVGPAVTRTRVKRRLRHLSRERLLGGSPLPPGAMLVVRALPAAAEASYERLGRDLDRDLRALLVRSPEADKPGSRR